MLLTMAMLFVIIVLIYVVEVAFCVVFICIFSGNAFLHEITSQARYSLRIDLEDFEDASRYAVYSNFAVASEANKYRLSLGAYSGTAGDCATQYIHTTCVIHLDIC